MMKNAVEVDRLRVVRGGRPVIPELTWSVPTGQVVGLLGPSGCGKTTLMRSLVGVQRVAGGRVDVLGRPAGSKTLRDKVGYVTQAPSVYADLTVTENLRYFASVVGVRRGALAEQVARVLELVDLTARAHAPVSQLSGGQGSRVSLAAALLGDPQLLVLDEPTVGLDPVLRRDLWHLFGELARGGTTLIVSSHVMDEATRCDRLLLMRDGRALADDTLLGLLERTGTDDVEAAFLTLVDDAAHEEAAR
ncbi:ABC transporter ATP-binding protein [Spongisporangium articulatum]|uniref:ABC transporter ATP-binding protein n=1 Tax=Spongisporangium articulatum TaxID=3362603 RepID=A0ABW8APV4_9ACTN